MTRSRSRVRLRVVALGILAWGMPASSRAQRTDPCLTAPVDGQKLRRDERLLAARDRFTVCGRDTCPAEIVQACVRWGAEVQGAIPSVVLAARDAEARDLADVRVSIDGAGPVPVGLRALEMDPGPHRFVFQRTGFADVASDVLLREGEKNREVVATFRLPAVIRSAPAPLGGGMTMAADRPVPAATWILGVVGVGALATYGVFGGLALTERSADGCSTGCAQADVDDVNGKFLVASVSLGVGLVSLGVATYLYFSRPSRRPSVATLPWVLEF